MGSLKDNDKRKDLRLAEQGKKDNGLSIGGEKRDIDTGELVKSITLFHGIQKNQNKSKPSTYVILTETYRSISLHCSATGFTASRYSH